MPPLRDVRFVHPRVHEREVLIGVGGDQLDHVRSGLGIVT